MSSMKIFTQPSQNIKLAIFLDNEGAENILNPAIFDERILRASTSAHEITVNTEIMSPFSLHHSLNFLLCIISWINKYKAMIVLKIIGITIDNKLK